MKKIIIVSDWSPDALSRQEVRSAIGGFVQSPENLYISYVHSSPSSIQMGYLLNQIVETEERLGSPLNTVIFQSSDPRLFSDQPLVEGAAGATSLIMRLKSGLYIIGANSKHNFSFIKPKIEELYTYAADTVKSQFRARDYYPRLVAFLADTLQDDLDLEEIDSSCIEELTESYIGHIDNYGNLKTTLTHDDLRGKVEYGETVEVSINGIKKQAYFVSNLFGGKRGQVVIYPGSSGPQNNPFLEISIWRHFNEEDTSTGIHIFNNPKPGDKVELVF